MNNQMLSTKTEKEIQKFVKNISLNSGIVSSDNMTYLEEVKMNINNVKQDIKQNMEQFKEDTKDIVLKLRVSSIKNEEFQEEILTHIIDHVKELVSNGMKEEEALKIVFSEFEGIDFTELNQDKGVIQMTNYDERMYEAIGVFYAGFLILGGAVGYLTGGWTGAIIGAIIGIGLGNVSHGLTAVLKKQ
jgi:replicative superfamily II helicase